ncbi:Sal family ABC-F type ribosomal protection protein [Staphylococcus edaphicus]|uniref:ATP-binding cassette domain-containing protein n=1 Tax=Staphylococcus edaphicus TaxID=1955013 RepID=A0A2C6WU62_9STAP|nr:Sal family ABC-F type ribosomal protection protein [Staphylococcus edaphicus]PHK50997.1 multidrug transporter [Staphylococcus edaphicus]UQW82688.1 ATP-binding cassette domain-containing protein [Staphylococcus edaphicus]
MSFYFSLKPFEQFGRVLINEVNIEVEPGEHIAIIGDNGVGKSTLLNAMHSKFSNQSYLMKQDLTDVLNETGIDFIISVFPKVAALRMKIENDYDKIGDYIALSGYEIEQKIITLAKRFNLSEQDLNKPIQLLSGGQQTSVALVRAFISEKAFIMLDEPTNHLDQDRLNDLISAINKSKQTIVYVSHHRGFINQTASHVYEITDKETRKFKGNYNQYKVVKDLELQSQYKAYEKQQKEVKALEESIQRINEWHASAKASASVRDPNQQKRLSKLAQKAKMKKSQLEHKINDKQLLAPEHDDKNYYFKDSQQFRKRVLVKFDSVSKCADQKIIYNAIDFEIKNEENILLTGSNGSGKSLLIALIRQKVKPDEGRVYITPSLKIACFDQQNNNLNYNQSPLDMVLSLEHMTRSNAQTILASFGFNKDKIHQTIRTLSMGEKGRLQFVLLYFSNPNLLILDEPTNYFDIATQDLILNMIEGFKGQVFIVTHDTYLQTHFKATHWTIKNKQLINVTMNSNHKINMENTVQLLKDFKNIDENGHYETDK